MAIQLKQFFKTAVALKNRFLTGDKPTQSVFSDLFDSVTFKKEKTDTATTIQQGLSKAALDTEAAAFQLNNNADGMTREVLPYQLPEVIAGDTSIVVTPVLYRQTLGTEGANVEGQTRRRYKITAAPYAKNGAWKTIGGGGNFDDGPAVPAYAVASTGTFEVRKTATNRVNLRGLIVISSPPWVGSATIFTMPVGYRPITLIYLFFTDIGYMTVDASGAVIFVGFVGVSQFLVPELEYSLD